MRWEKLALAAVECECMDSPVGTATVRLRLEVRGLVQGIGFRPFIWQLARQLRLSGFVGNHSEGAFVEIEGPPEAVDAFVIRLRSQPPALARVDSITVSNLPLHAQRGFRIVESKVATAASTPVSADLGICADCLRELRDPANRRFGYPFLNCTQCGPRFTITLDIPYDRPRTTMAPFVMCAACQAEYQDPGNRRFHAQPNACWDCGPTVWLVTCGEASATFQPRGREALRAARLLLDGGGILAVKGIGGFHLACDARNEDAVARLRLRKGRAEKPFAVMVDGLDTVRRIAFPDREEETLLAGRERPIVLVAKRQDAALGLAREVAPESPHWGLMLAYTPLHHLLLDSGEGAERHERDAPRVLVMTSGNCSEEPIARDNAEAMQRLAPMADAFLLHDRGIHVVADDSVVRVFSGCELPVRRSRGYAPLPVKLHGDGSSVVAVGGELKAAFCITKGSDAYLSQHIGDLGNLETQQAFERALEHFLTLFRVKPEAVVCDLHPGYLSTAWARTYASERGLPFMQVQHHHAHVASLMAEHGLDDRQPLLGVALDGTGFGEDGAIWGGEFLRVEGSVIRRVAHLRYVPLPGGDAAIRHPWRCAVAHLWDAGCTPDEIMVALPGHGADFAVLLRQLERALRCVPTSSAGRLFDAAAALVGLRHSVSFEAQAAMQLEALCQGQPSAEAYPMEILPLGVDGDDARPFVVDPRPLWRAMLADRKAGVEPSLMAARFHASVAAAIVRVCVLERERRGLTRVGLTGGVFQNVRLLGETVDALSAEGFVVLHHRVVPPNDGGLSLGQAWLARGTHGRTEAVSPKPILGTG